MITKQRLMVFWLFLLCGVPLAGAQTAQQIAKRAFDSTVLLIMEDTNGQPVGLGSGFFVKPQQIATNLHVIEGAASGYAKLVGQKTKYEIVGVSAIDRKRDLAILNVEAWGIQALSLGDSDTVMVGETVYAVGNPHGLEGTFSQGIVSGVRTVRTDKLIQLTAPISPGSSGGPVLNDSGNVVGVSVAMFRSGQNLNFAIPSNYLSELISRIRPPTPLSQSQQGKSRRSILSNYGGRSVEGVTAGKFKYSRYNSNGRIVQFSFRNRLRKDVKNVRCLLIFYDELGGPIQAYEKGFEFTKVLSGLASRASFFITTDVWSMCCYGIDDPITAGRIEFRILDFDIVEAGKK